MLSLALVERFVYAPSEIISTFRINSVLHWESDGVSILYTFLALFQACRPRGCWGVPCGTPYFGRSVNPISTKGVDYAHQIILTPTDYQPFRQPCLELQGEKLDLIFFEVK